MLCFAFDDKTYSEIDGVTICRIKIKKQTRNTLFVLFNRFRFYELFWENKIKKFIKANSIDIVHTHDLYMSKSAHLAIKSQKNKIPLILDLHENFPQAIKSYNWTKGFIRNLISNPNAWVKKEAEYLSYASKVIVLSDTYKNVLIKRYKFLTGSNVISFPNVIDFKQFKNYKINHNIIKSDKVTLMYFGRVAERRGIFQTIEVFNKCLEKKLNLELLIIGTLDKADQDNFNNLINSEQLKDNIKYIPWIDISKLVSYMNISDILLSPLIKNKQHESGVANKIFQYMYGAKPIIVSDCKPQKDLVESFNCGLSYSNNEEFLDCITKLSEDKKLRHELGTNGFQKLHEKYDSQDYEKILLNLYGEIV